MSSETNMQDLMDRAKSQLQRLSMENDGQRTMVIIYDPDTGDYGAAGNIPAVNAMDVLLKHGLFLNQVVKNSCVSSGRNDS